MRAALILGAGFFAVSLFAMGPAHADNACMERCSANGSPYGLCQERCSSGGHQNSGNNNGSGNSGGGKPNYACMSQCTSRGYSPDFCQARCN
jgi:hypothetical protein